VVDVGIVMSVLAAIFSVFFGINTAKRNAVNDIEKKAREQGKILESLGNIETDVKDIKVDVKTAVEMSSRAENIANKALMKTEQIQQKLNLN